MDELMYGWEFQIVRERDWEQVLHPQCEHSIMDLSDPVLEPDGDGHGLNWFVDGIMGKDFRIEMHQRSEGLFVSWRYRGCKEPFDAAAIDMYQASLEECAQGSRWEAAAALLADMKLWCVETNMKAHRLGIDACCRGLAWVSALWLLDEMWQVPGTGPEASDYNDVAQACEFVGKPALARSLVSEVKRWHDTPNRERFQVVPAFLWNRQLRMMSCSVDSSLDWSGGEPVPLAPHSCWLLPCTDEFAVHIAERQEQLEQAGWRLLTCEPNLVSRLSNKADLHRHAEDLGLLNCCHDTMVSFKMHCTHASSSLRRAHTGSALT